MNCAYRLNLPKEWEDLKPSVRQKINEAVNTVANQRIDQEEVEMQKTWILYGAVALAEAGATKDEILCWIGSWKRIYRANGRMKTKEEQEAFIRAHLAILGDDYPFDFIDSLERV
ncbi:MAG: hypothetical protein J6S14_12895 [Clostridia bacterium]|jgi:hypothetical protein|nr:hypothetical protein [Clostridia bacterium]